MYADGEVSNSSAITITYAYDPLDRLTAADYSDGSFFHYTYDAVGNRLIETTASGITDYAYDAANRMTQAGSTIYSWDENGNLLNDGTHSYLYDSANRLIAASDPTTTSSFGYDGLGNRYQQAIDGVTTVYTFDLVDGLPQVLEDGTYTYFYGLDRLAQQSATRTGYYLTDALGSVRQITGADGAPTLSQSFDPFGNLTHQSGRTASLYGYAGEQTDATGLQFLRARYYAPEQGRFITKDPFPGLLTQPASLAPYAYALNNPIFYTDPSGKFVDTLFDIVSLGYDIYTIGEKLNRGCAIVWSDWAALGVDALSLVIPFVPAAGSIIFKTASHGSGIWDTLRAIEGFNEYAGSTAKFIKQSDDADIVYRVMRAEQHPSSLVEGIIAKNPLANYEPRYHVMQGNKQATNWISTTRDLEWAKTYSSPDNPIYMIDLNKVTNTVVDTTIPGVMNGWFYQAKVLAGELPHKKSYFEKVRCFRKNVTLASFPVGGKGNQDDQQRQTRTAGGSSATLSKSQQRRQGQALG